MNAKFILNEKVAIDKYNEVKELADIVSYSSKTNPEITTVLEKETKSMFSVHLINELKNIKDKSRIIFLAQAWKKNLIKQLYEKGIRWFVVDNLTDLDEFFKSDIPHKEITLSLRLKIKENTTKTERYFVFGMDSKIINQCIEKYHNQVKEIGIHFHKKTQNVAEWNLREDVQDSILEKNLNLIKHINIGGGLPSMYANSNINAVNYAKVKIKEFKKFLDNKKLIIEPGRFISAPAIELETEIIAMYDNVLIVNASVYNTDLDALIVPVKLLVKNELNEGKSYVIKGITPCSLDMFRYKVKLDKPKVGDKITFINAGAYNFSTEFCNLEKLDTIIKK